MKPVAIVYAPWHSVESKMLSAAVDAGMDIAAAASLQAFSTALYRDPDATGMLWSQGPASAAETVRRMRQGDCKSRIIVLIHELPPFGFGASAIADVLMAGADDCQPAKIDSRELAARLKVLAARGDYFDHHRIEFLGCAYDPETRNIESEVAAVNLTPREGRLLVHLFRNQDIAISKEQIMDELYGDEDEPMSKIVDVFICKLRRKIVEATGGRDVIETVWGRGYRFNPEGFVPQTMPTRFRGPRSRVRASA